MNVYACVSSSVPRSRLELPLCLVPQKAHRPFFHVCSTRGNRMLPCSLFPNESQTEYLPFAVLEQ
ncbi:MAG: hypothetical protein CNCCGFBP_01259 [Fimbriimonadaceae bacterium]|nr:hypothetical protein [Fimbriimonadaceae bacterium]